MGTTGEKTRDSTEKDPMIPDLETEEETIEKIIEVPEEIMTKEEDLKIIDFYGILYRINKL